MSSFNITQLIYNQMKMEHKAYNYLLASVFVENIDEIVEFENLATRFLAA